MDCQEQAGGQGAELGFPVAIKFKGRPRGRPFLFGEDVWVHAEKCKLLLLPEVDLFAYAPSCEAQIMSRTQTFVTVGFGAYFAAVLYLKLAMEPGRMFSHTAFGIVAYLALLAVPAIFVALNIGRKSIWTVVSALALMVGMFAWICLNALVAGMPGSEWVERGQMNSLLAMPALSTVALPLRLKAAIPTLGMAFFASFVLIMVGLPISMRYLLDQQIQATLMKGGCVESATRANIASAHDIQFGWFVGSSSEQVRFIEKQGYSKWSYSSFGIAMRRDMPIVFEPDEKTNLSKCLSSKIQ